ncbi:hypothetical protein LO763_20290 [Glycomyces sp. A-F 0318]|uniref:hypothetical protein n=1 Tax=Glycomyces amatae TaxID=2881355 RepID=UPI001E3F6C0B|nr:hypothetical protein [Glycomyces amatae]MCD0445954.1 hypothetical protein [Glycomyces amatae]
MEPLRTKPVYHHPIPWQVATALPLLGCNVLSLVLQARAILDYGVAPPPSQAWPALDAWPALAVLHLICTVVAAAACAAAAVCIAARRDWARTTAVAVCVVLCFYYVPIAIGFTVVPLVIDSGFAGGLLASVCGALALCLALLHLLHGEEAAAYTYKGGRWPEE